MQDIANSQVWLFVLAGMTSLVLFGAIVAVLMMVFKEKKKR